MHLLSSSNPAVLQASYPFLQRAAAKRTEYLVIESAATSLTVEATAAEDGEPVPVDEPAVPKIALPDELLALLQLRLDVELDDVESAESLALLPVSLQRFGGCLVLTHPLGMAGDALCMDASLRLVRRRREWHALPFQHMLISGKSAKIKAGFVEQLRELDLIETFFAPNILGLLNVTQTAGSGAARKPYKLDAWVVDEFYLSCVYFLIFDSSTYPFELSTTRRRRCRPACSRRTSSSERLTTRRRSCARGSSSPRTGSCTRP